MLNFEQFKAKICRDRDKHGWLNAYIDQDGNYYVQGYGGMGTTIFTKLARDHPFNCYLDTLLDERLLKERPFKQEPEAEGVELAFLEPLW